MLEGTAVGALRSLAALVVPWEYAAMPLMSLVGKLHDKPIDLWPREMTIPYCQVNGITTPAVRQEGDMMNGPLDRRARLPWTSFRGRLRRD